MTTTRVKAQDAVFVNSGTYTPTDFLHTAPAFPMIGGVGTGLKLGFNYTPYSQRLLVYGGGIRNSWHMNSIGMPWMTWQEQMKFSLKLPNAMIPFTYEPGVRYLANRHNWSGYQAIFGLRERSSDYSLIDPEVGRMDFVDNYEPKDAVISFAYPRNAVSANKSRLIFESIALDTFQNPTGIGDEQTELATLNHRGNLGFRTSDPQARIHIQGTEGQNTSLSLLIKDNNNTTRLSFLNSTSGGYLAVNKSSAYYNLDLDGTVSIADPNYPSSTLQFYGGNTEINGGFKIKGQSADLLRSDGTKLYLDQFKITNPNPVDGYLMVDRSAGEVKLMPAFSSGGSSNSHWSLTGNTFGSTVSSVNFGSTAFGNAVDVNYIIGGTQYGTMYGYNSAKAGLFEWTGSYAIGGYFGGPAPQASQDVTLSLVSRDDKTGYIGINSPPSTILRTMNHTGAVNFEVLSSGTIFLGSYTGPSNLKYASIVQVGTHSSSSSAPPYSLAKFKGNGDFEFAFAQGSGALFLGNNSYLDPSGQIMEWDGSILPYVGVGVPTGNYNLGSSSQYWNTVYAANTTVQFSDVRLKENVHPLKNGIDVIKLLNPVTFTWKNKELGTDTYYGFIAQELKRVFPNSIVTGEESDSTYLGVRYSEIIPILTKAMQEQQEIIEHLNQEIVNIRQALPADGKLVKSENNDILNKVPILFQNTPNPFNQKTSIDYFIPDGTKQASIMVTNQSGQVVYSAIINKTGMGRIILDDEFIPQGTYFYTLYVDGQIIDTKQMLVVKD